MRWLYNEIDARKNQIQERKLSYIEIKIVPLTLYPRKTFVTPDVTKLNFEEMNATTR